MSTTHLGVIDDFFSLLRPLFLGWKSMLTFLTDSLLQLGKWPRKHWLVIVFMSYTALEPNTQDFPNAQDFQMVLESLSGCNSGCNYALLTSLEVTYDLV